jgi:HK97 family phage portal protein
MGAIDSIKKYIAEKLNPAQSTIVSEEGENIGSGERINTYYDAYDKLEVVRNGVDRIANAFASFDYDVMGQISGVPQKIRPAKLKTLLNYRPNPFQDIHRFRRNIALDFILDGNIFLYFDGAHLYHLPAFNVVINTDPITFVKSYEYSNTTTFKPEEIIHIAENNPRSIYRGSSRMASAMKSINVLYSMQQFQENFFKHGAIMGLIIESENVLGDKMKDRLLQSWQQRYSPSSGGRRPLILDGGMKARSLMETSFNELDFEDSIKSKEEGVLLALGVPYILLRGGNNANISPNLRLFYLETIYPIANMFTHAMEAFFGFDVAPMPDKVSALQPEMKESSAYYTTLVNGGVITPNEAREELRYQPKPDGDDLRVPANIAGSAANPAEGGKPPGDKPK